MRFSSALFVFASLIAVSFSSTPADVRADIVTIAADATAYDDSITAFPNVNGTVVEALAIHSTAVTLGKDIDKGTTDIKALLSVPLSNVNAQAIYDAVLAFAPTIEHALTTIVLKRPALEALPESATFSLIKQDLTNLNASTTAFENAIIIVSPAGVRDEEIELKLRLDRAFAVAIAAYS